MIKILMILLYYKLVVQSTGTIEDLTMLEAIDFNKATEKAQQNWDINTIDQENNLF